MDVYPITQQIRDLCYNMNIASKLVGKEWDFTPEDLITNGPVDVLILKFGRINIEEYMITLKLKVNHKKVDKFREFRSSFIYKSDFSMSKFVDNVDVIEIQIFHLDDDKVLNAIRELLSKYL